MKRTYRSSGDTWTAWDDCDLHQTDCIAIAFIIAIFLHRTVDAPHNHGLLDRAIVTIQSPEAQSDGLEDSRKNFTIADRSNRDRGSSIVESTPRSRCKVSIQNGKRNIQDQGPIAWRSWTDRQLIVTTIKSDRGSD